MLPGAKVFSASKQQFEGRVRKVIFGFGLDDENAIFTGLDIPIAFSRSAVLPCSRAAQATRAALQAGRRGHAIFTNKTRPAVASG